MKKIFTSFIVVTMMVLCGLSPVKGLSYDESYQATKDYYAKKTELQGASEVTAYASLGLDASHVKMDNVINTDYASSIAQTVISLVLHGDDPRNYKDINYVEMLEKCVQENGAFDKTNQMTYANYQIYGVYALYIVNSQKLEIAANYLASLQSQTGAFGSSLGESVDITAWSIEALSLANKTKYQSVIDKAIAYMNTSLDGEAGYKDSYSGVNVNTQASALIGLLAYDAQGVKNGKYNQEQFNPYDVLLRYQNSNGSFWYSEQGEENYYATTQAAQAVGYYYNGSVYAKAHELYLKLINKTEEEKTDETKPVTPPKEDMKDKNQYNKRKVVETADSSDILLYSGLMMMSAFVILKGKRRFE